MESFLRVDKRSDDFYIGPEKVLKFVPLKFNFSRSDVRFFVTFRFFLLKGRQTPLLNSESIKVTKTWSTSN